MYLVVKDASDYSLGRKIYDLDSVEKQARVCYS